MRKRRARLRSLLVFATAIVILVKAGDSSCQLGDFPFTTARQSDQPADGDESVTVTWPNGSERCLAGGTYNITWAATVSSGLVKVEYSPNGGTTWSVFKVNTPNDGSEPWTVPNIPSAMWLVRVSDALDGTPSDTSDSWFRVEPAGSVPLITTKTSGEITVAFLQGSSGATSEIGFGYAIATTPAANRYILFQGLPQNPSPTTEQNLGFMPAGSGLDFYVITEGVSQYSGFLPNQSFWDTDNSLGWGGTIVEERHIGVEDYLLHLDRATGGIDDDNDFLMEVKISPVGESPPVAVVQTPSGVQSGNVSISYTLKDVQGDECTIMVFVSEDGGVSWKPATQGPGGDGTSDLTSSRTGQNHIFVWDSVADIGLTSQNDIRIRIVPFDTKQGTPSDTGNFSVNNVPPPKLSCLPDSFSFEAMEGGPDPASQLMEVWNSGGGALDWRVETLASWLLLSPRTGQSTGEKDRVSVAATVVGLSHGVYDATVTVSAAQLPGVTIEVPVRLTVVERVPMLSVSPDVLNFSTWEGGPNPAPQDFTVQNTGGQNLSWRVSWEILWLKLSPESGTSTGEIDTVQVSVDVAGLTAGWYGANVTVSAPEASNSPLSVAVFLEITEPPPLLSVSPTAIVFDCTEGDSPAPAEIVIRNAGTGEFSWEISDDAEWLSVSPETGRNSGEANAVEVRASTTGLLPGTYRATITVSATTLNSPQKVDVTLLVRERPPTLFVSPALLSFSSFEGGENPVPQELKVKNAGRGEMDWHASADVAWMQISPQEGVTAGEEDSVQVSVDIAGLKRGSYTGQITLSSLVAINSPVGVTVLLEISEPPPTLSVTPGQLLFDGVEEGDDPVPQEIEIRNVGAGEFSWEASDDAPWLSLAPASGSNSGETDIVQASVSTSGLVAGTYTATITVGATARNSPQTVSVRLVVAEPPPPVLEVAPSSLDFSAVEGGDNPPPQQVKVRNAGGREMAWRVLSDAAWLSAAPESGSSKGEEDVIKVSVRVSELLPGTHSGTLTVTGAGAANSPQSVQVRIVVAENPPVLAVSPLELAFVAEEGGAEPAPQDFCVRNQGGRAMEWQSSADQSWIRLTPQSGTNTGSPETVKVSIASQGMEPGDYSGAIKVEAPGARNSPQMVSVRLTLKAVKAELFVSPESLDFSTRRGGSNPPSKTLTITTRFYKPVTWLAEENAEWLSVSPSSDSNFGEADVVTVSVDKTGLDLGRYETEITVRDAQRPNCKACVKVVLSVKPIRVPEEYATIQAAIDASQKGDVILVRQGTYREKIRMKSHIEVFGEGAETTAIDCGGKGTAVAFIGIESATLEGFTIKGGTGERFGRGAEVGGGIYVYRSSPHIAGCWVENNSAVWGGGICIDTYSAPVLADCRICENSAVMGAGLFFYEDCSATILTTRICQNSAEWYGGGMCLASSSSVNIRSSEITGNSSFYAGGAAHGASGCDIELVSCTVAGNCSPEGAAFFMEEFAVMEAVNTIIWGNTSPMVLLGEHIFRHCDIEESGLAGKDGNISSDPLFAAPNDGDYHLLPCSPCVDVGTVPETGLSATDVDAEPRIMEGPLGAVTDIGADEVNPDVPAVVAESVSQIGSGLVRISYKLYHLLGVPCSVLVEYSADGGTEWRRATRAPQGDGTFGLSSSISGETHYFVWDSIADEGGARAEGILLRLTPQSALTGTSRVSQPFSLDNARFDTDNDKLLDAWEQIIIDANLNDAIRSLSDVSGEGDFDGDGKTERSEYLAGTSPVDPQSCLRLVCVPATDGEAVLRWPSAIGRIYRLFCCDGMGNGWHALREAIPGTGSWIEFRDATASQKTLRFYRIGAE